MHSFLWLSSIPLHVCTATFLDLFICRWTPWAASMPILLEISSCLPPGDGISTHLCRVFRPLGNLSRRNSLWSWTSQITRQFQNSNLVHIKLSFIYSMIRICGTLRILLLQRTGMWQADKKRHPPHLLHPGDPVWTISWLSAIHLSLGPLRQSQPTVLSSSYQKSSKTYFGVGYFF